MQKNKIIEQVTDNGQIDFDGLRALCDAFEADNEFCQTKKVHISDEMLMSFLNALDLDGNGVLDTEETVGTILSRKEIGSQTLTKTKKI